MYWKASFYFHNPPDKCPIPDSLRFKADKSQKLLENRLSNSYI